jgi:hypothetical protein
MQFSSGLHEIAQIEEEETERINFVTCNAAHQPALSIYHRLQKAGTVDGAMKPLLAFTQYPQI